MSKKTALVWLIFTLNDQNYFKNPKLFATIPEICDDHNFKMKYENCVKMCSFGYSTVFFLITRFKSKVDLGLFGNYRMTLLDMFRIDLESISFLRSYCQKFMLGVKIEFEELVEARIFFFCILFLCKCLLRQNWLWYVWLWGTCFHFYNHDEATIWYCMVLCESFNNLLQFLLLLVFLLYIQPAQYL